MSQTEITAIIPVRIDSEDRKKNIITAVEFLLKHHYCNIILKEVDVSQKLVPPTNKRLKYIFEQSKEGEPFHRTRILNDMLCEVMTPYTINYDCDMLIPHSTMKKCLDMLKNGYDLVYPYPKGNLYFTFDLDDKQRRYFINESNTNYMDYLFEKYAISLNENNIWFFIDTELDGVVCTGGMQFFNTESYKKGFGENELFVDWGPEDYERLFRFYTLGYKVGWVDSGNILHMNHKKTDSSNDTSRLRKSNTKMWHDILMRRRKKDDMLDFMKSLKYVKERFNT
jgi:hypothetical protein